MNTLLTLGASVFVLNFWVSLVAQLLKESTCNAGDLGSITGLGKSPGEGNGYLLKFQDGRVEGHVLIFSCKNSKITILCWTTIDRRMVNPTKKKDTPHPRERRSPSKMVGGVKSSLEWNPISGRTIWELTQTLCTRTRRPHRDWARTVSEHLRWRSGSAVACRRGRGSGCSRPGYGISSLGGGCHKVHHRAARTYRRLRKQTLGGHKQNFVHSRTQEEGTVPTETDPDLPVSVQESPAEVWVCSGLLQGQGHQVWQCVHGTFWRRSPLSPSPPPWLGLSQTQGGNTAPPINRKLN